MPETQLDEDCVRKRKTTYPHEHPTDNPKPPKRSKAEIQQAAKEKKEAQLAKKLAAETEKKKRILDAEEKRKLSAQRIASVEDSVQRLQKARQSRSERPDLKMMEAYQKVQKQKELNTPEVDEFDDNDDMYTDGPQFLQESNIDTDSDAVILVFLSLIVMILHSSRLNQTSIRTQMGFISAVFQSLMMIFLIVMIMKTVKMTKTWKRMVIRRTR